MSNANVNRKRAAKTRNKLEMEIEDEPGVKKIMLKRRSLSKRQQKPPKYFEFYKIGTKMHQKCSEAKQINTDQKSIDSIDQPKRKSTNKLQDVKSIVCTNEIIPDIENEKIVDDQTESSESSCEEIQTDVDSDHPVLEHPVLDHPVLDHPVLDHPVLEHPVLDHPVLDHPVLDNPMMDQPVPISREAPISSSTEATKPSEAFLQTISSGMI